MSGSPFSEEETATILAGLRLLQLAHAQDDVPPIVYNVLTNDDGIEMILGLDEIDALCEKVNFL